MSGLTEDLGGPGPSDAERSRRPRLRSRVDLLVVALCSLAVGLVLLAGVLVVAASDTSVQGQVEGGGWGGRGCYPTVSYAVDGRDYVLHAEKDTRWCGLHLPGPAQVYYEPGDPQEARLARYGDAPGQLLAGALAALVVAGFLSTRERPEAAAPPGRGRSSALRGRVGRIPRILVAGLVVGWLVASIAVVATGERRSSLDGLQAAVDRGTVTEVAERGALVTGQRGISTVRLAWRERGLRHFTTVVQYRGRVERRAPPGATDVVVGDLAEQLQQGGADVAIEPDLRSTGPRFLSYVPWGWQVLGWPVYLTLALLLVTVRVLTVAGPPRRATHWAWFWLLAAAPVPLALAYLTLGWRGGWTRRRAGDRARLRGTAAFLVATALTALQRALG